jgi:hypothetical protein
VVAGGDLARCVSGGGFQGDSVSECLELANVVAFGVFGAGAGGVEVRAEVVEAGLVVAEEMPDDHKDGSTDRNDGFLLASSSSDASVAFAKEGVGSSGADGRFAQDPGEVAVAVSGGAVSFAAAGGFLDPGREPSP